MAYRFQRGQSVAKNVKRVACEQLDKALDEIENDQLDRHETVHQVRKRSKKLRGLLRLVRPRIEETYRSENAWFRDAARRLSHIRDATSIIETYDKLMDRFRDEVERSSFATVRRTLTSRRKRIADEVHDLDARLEEFAVQMRQARERVEGWPLDAGGFKAVKGGLQKTYARGVAGLESAYGDPTTENFHEWRKRVKYHWYHTRLLRNVWKPAMQQRRDALDELSDLLGDDHDLAVFRATLLDSPGDFGDESTLQALAGLIDRRRAELQALARPLGERLFADKPKHLVRRLGAWWSAWYDEKKVRPEGLQQFVPAGA